MKTAAYTRTEGKKPEPYQFLVLAHVFPGLHLGFVHGMHLSKVTFVKIFNQRPLLMGHFLNRYKVCYILKCELISNPF